MTIDRTKYFGVYLVNGTFGADKTRDSRLVFVLENGSITYSPTLTLSGTVVSIEDKVSLTESRVDFEEYYKFITKEKDFNSDICEFDIVWSEDQKYEVRLGKCKKVSYDLKSKKIEIEFYGTK